jgi:hypothetical protein
MLTLFLVMRRQVSDADPKALEDEKKKNLSGQQKSPHPEDAPGWNEVLAVSSCFPLLHTSLFPSANHHRPPSYLVFGLELTQSPSPQSESEAVIKAERSESEPIEKLQEETIKHVHSKN